MVDLDPYGSAVPFLDSAMQAISHGGLMCITFTDMAVLCTSNYNVQYYKYGATVQTHKKHCHEYALRMIMHMLNTRYQKHVQPLLCLTVDFYVRLFVRVYDTKSACHGAITKSSYVF